MPKLTFQWNSMPNLILGAEVHRLVPKLFRAEVTGVEHRLPPFLDLRHLDASAGHETSLVKQFLVILTRCIEKDVINNSIFDLFDGPKLQQTISFILILLTFEFKCNFCLHAGLESILIYEFKKSWKGFQTKAESG